MGVLSVKSSEHVKDEEPGFGEGMLETWTMGLERLAAVEGG